MKYKVGDKVKIKEGALAGNIYTISHIESCRHIELSDLPYVFFDYELEPVGLPKGLVSIHDVDTHELWTTPFIIPKDRLDALVDAWAKLGCTTVNLVADEVKEVIEKTEEKKMPTKFTFYTVEGYRMDKSNNTKIPTVTTEVIYKDKDGCATGGSATCDKADYSERDGILNAIANAVLGGNFDREYEKFLADKKHKYDESCKCKICGRNYYEDEKTGKRTPFTPEDARKHEEWHEQNKKNKREKYLIRKEAKRRLAEAEREGKIEQVMKELYKK